VRRERPARRSPTEPHANRRYHHILGDDMGRVGSRTTILVFTFSIWAAISSLGQVQTGNDDWRKRPDPLVSAKSDSVSPGVRAIRNKFFDRVYGPRPKGVFSDGPDVGPIFEEIPTFKGLTVAIVRFADCSSSPAPGVSIEEGAPLFLRLSVTIASPVC
jgi:hypothetical protein